MGVDRKGGLSVNDFKGKEVSCMTLALLEKPLKEKGYSKEVLAEWGGYRGRRSATAPRHS